jgi:hypothetical protein
MENSGGPRWMGWRIAMWGSAAGLLLLPLLAMQFFPAAGVNWTGSDFVVMGVLLSACCGIVELGAWLSGNTWYRAAFAVAVLAGFLLIWVSLAVGIIAEESDRANLMFVGVLATGIIGALLARFKPEGMARTLVATAAAQMLVGVIALVGRMGYEAIAIGSFLAAMWLLSAWLFRKAAGDRKSPAAIGKAAGI